MLISSFDNSILIGISLSILLGALVGLEREFRKGVEKKIIYLGFRTSILTSLLGFVFGYFYTLTYNITTLAISYALITVIASMVYLAKVNVHKSVGATTYIAAILVFTGGFLIGLGQAFFAAVLIIITAAILAIKEHSKKFISLLSKEEIYSTIKFSIIAFVILPFLPNEPIDSFGVFNPFYFWLIVVIFSSLNFVLYILSKIHRKGLFLSSLISGFISSNMTAYTLSEFLKKGKIKENNALSGIFISLVGMLISQVIVISIIVSGTLLIIKSTLLPVLFLIVLLILLSLKLDSFGNSKLDFESPFSVKTAILFATIFLIIGTALLAFKDLFGLSSFYIISFVSSIVNVGANIASLSLLVSKNIITLQMFGELVIISLISGIISKLIWIIQSNNKALFYKFLKYSIFLIVCLIFVFYIQSAFI